MKSYKSYILFVLLWSGFANASTITFEPQSNTAALGDIFTLDIVGIGFIENVDGGGINLAFDGSVLNVLSVTIDETVWDFGNTGISTGVLDNTSGTIDGLMVNAFSDVTGDFTVTSIEFQAIGFGSTLLTLSEFTLNPWASGGSVINPGYIDGSVTVVPVPVAAWLFGSGLISLIGLARRKS